jgi:hypothetical protein
MFLFRRPAIPLASNFVTWQMKLTYSSVDQPELVGYLALLAPFEPSLEIEEIVGYGDAVRDP